MLAAYLSKHEDELVSVEDDYGGKASSADYISGFEGIRTLQHERRPRAGRCHPAPRDLTRAELKEIAVLLDGQGYSEASCFRLMAASATPTSPRN